MRMPKGPLHGGNLTCRPLRRLLQDKVAEPNPFARNGVEEQRFLIKGRTYLATDPELQEALAGVYDTPERPRCLCVRGGIEMYVAKHRRYVVKRMPDRGHRHHP